MYLYVIFAIAAAMLGGIAQIVTAAVLENKERNQRNKMVDPLYRWGARAVQAAFLMIFLFCSLLVGCHHRDFAVGSEETADATEVPYECRSECNCDLNYCDDFNDVAKGNWESSYYREFCWDENGESLGELEYPYTDEEGCIREVTGSISVIPFKSEDWGCFMVYEGVLSGKFTERRHCLNSTTKKEAVFSYWYWNLCVPQTFFCGMRLYDEWGNVTGEVDASVIYDFKDASTLTWLMIEISGLSFRGAPYCMAHSYLDKAGDVGKCDEDQFHCYHEEGCSELQASCTDSIEECAAIGGKSYSQHRDGHEREWCFDIDGIVR